MPLEASDVPRRRAPLPYEVPVALVGPSQVTRRVVARVNPQIEGRAGEYPQLLLDPHDQQGGGVVGLVAPAGFLPRLHGPEQPLLQRLLSRTLEGPGHGLQGLGPDDVVPAGRIPSTLHVPLPVRVRAPGVDGRPPPSVDDEDLPELRVGVERQGGLQHAPRLEAHPQQPQPVDPVEDVRRGLGRDGADALLPVGDRAAHRPPRGAGHNAEGRGHGASGDHGEGHLTSSKPKGLEGY